MTLTPAQTVICVVFATVLTLAALVTLWPAALRMIDNIREYDARALYNRQIQANRDREEREAERGADNAAAWQRKLRGEA